MNGQVNSLNSTKVKKWLKNFLKKIPMPFLWYLFLGLRKYFQRHSFQKLDIKFGGILCFIHLSKLTLWLLLNVWPWNKQQFSTLAYSDKYLFYLWGFFACCRLSCVLPSTFVYFKWKTFCFKRMHVVKWQKEYTLNSILSSSLFISQMLANHFSRELPLTGF